MITTTIVTNLLTNMVLLSLQGTVPTNTRAFQEYAFNVMFTHATNMAAKWNLDLPNPITTNMISEFKPSAWEGGAGGDMVLSNRYYFSWLYGGLPNFDDEAYSCLKTQTPDVVANDAILEQWMHATNLLTLPKARQIAERAILSLGVPLNKVNFKEPQEAWQFKYEWKDGKNYSLPYYRFYWNTQKAACTVEVSGIIGRVAYFSFTDYTSTYLWFQKPTNYFEILGLPTNAVFVRRYYTMPGQPQRYELIQ